MLNDAIINAVADLLACPKCKNMLSLEHDELTCVSCGTTYETYNGETINFLEGPPPNDSAYEIIKSNGEDPAFRINNFYVPFLRKLVAKRHLEPGKLRVLDSGCGAGGAVEILRSEGYDCWGIDLGSRRKLWSDLRYSSNLLVADGTSLPFKDSSFDLVFSFGVIEHVGVSGDIGYSMSPSPECNSIRKSFIAENIRVLRPGGIFFLAHPNGAFPIDFWHGGGRNARLHIPYEGFLPSMKDIKKYCNNIDQNLILEPISPLNHLSFERISSYWYGRVFKRVMLAFFALMAVRPFTVLSRSPINPFLVIKIAKPPA